MDYYPQKKVMLMGVAGSNTAFSLSLYNLKAYAYNDPLIRKVWSFSIIQHPLIDYTHYTKKAVEHCDLILKVKPDLVAFSCYMWNIHYFQLLTQQLKEKSPNLKILFGGPEITTDYITEGHFDKFAIDFCISGEGELTFLELLRSLTNDQPELSSIKGLSYRTQLKQPFSHNGTREAFKSLSHLPSPYLTGIVDDDILFRHNVEANIETQRGCNLRCSYCVYHKDMPRISYSDINRTLDEVRYVVNKGVKKIRFVDANFTSKLDHAKTIMRGLIERQFEVRLMFELIPGFIDEELVILFHEFNQLYEWNDVTLGVGVQTINLQVLKKIRRSIKLNKFEKTFDLLQKYHIYAKIDLIIGLPGEDLSSIERTLEYMMDKLRYSQSHLLCCHIMRGLPGTELLQIAKDYDMVFTSELEPHELYESPALPRKDMLKCLRRTAVIFRLVNHSGWANKEFIYETRSDNTNIRDIFFKTRNRLNLSNIELIDLVIDGLMSYLPEESYFVQERFPYAETWWWGLCKREIQNQWMLNYLQKL